MTLDGLATMMQVAGRQRCIHGTGIIALAGTSGMMRPSACGKSVVITVNGTADHRSLKQLVDDGVLTRLSGADTFELRRPPADECEIAALRELIGLKRDRCEA
jgi:hypothetical protein